MKTIVLDGVRIGPDGHVASKLTATIREETVLLSTSGGAALVEISRDDWLTIAREAAPAGGGATRLR